MNRDLSKHAHRTRSYILEAGFAASHLPPMVRLGGGTMRRWLSEPCRPLGDRIPIEMCSAEESALELMDYLRQQAIKCCV